MESLEELLRHYVVAFSDGTRGAILLELDHADELTATQLAKRLGLTANNVYHHMRVLTGLGVVEQSRVVPGPTYVEKYYRLKPEHRAMMRGDPNWMDRTQATIGPEERKALMVGMCLAAAHTLQRAARRYQAMDAEELDTLAWRQMAMMVSINAGDRKRLNARLSALREVLREEHEAGADVSDEPRTDVIIMAGLPFVWDAGE